MTNLDLEITCLAGQGVIVLEVPLLCLDVEYATLHNCGVIDLINALTDFLKYVRSLLGDSIFWSREVHEAIRREVEKLDDL